MGINDKLAKTSSISFALMLVVSIFAFGYLLGGETKTVSAADSTTPTIKILKAIYKIFKINITSSICNVLLIS